MSIPIVNHKWLTKPNSWLYGRRASSSTQAYSHPTNWSTFINAKSCDAVKPMLPKNT
ncbi:hypothetical protein QWZ16_22870 [Vibrio ostreicida]|uniref:Uncharacterized protein n=1 Tax=Vibrio ostreicida TaxID=526588 RepID=A0ABT8BZ58_9VIBR|nr:hypothetical protein [Vibrio ostreicida]MDN3612446.1 hypothetical protein [Vibrio ostreicida]